MKISTHTPLAGRDNIRFKFISIDSQFLLTRPLRDVTAELVNLYTVDGISTHTPLAGRDF